MILAHFTLATADVERTAAFFEQALGYPRNPAPANVPMASIWLNIGRGQEMHVTYVDGFSVSPFEGEFGRQGVGDLHRQVLLDLEAPREHVHDPRGLRQTYDFSVGYVSDVRLTDEWKQMVLA